MTRIWFIVPVLVLFVGCTMPSQRIAAEAIDRGAKQEHNIITDLTKIAKQSAVDNGVAKARAAAASNNPDAAQAAVQEAVTQFDKIAWLQIQHERARSLIRVGQSYIWSQKGIFDIMVEEFQEAKKRSDAAEIAESVSTE